MKSNNHSEDLLKALNELDFPYLSQYRCKMCGRCCKYHPCTLHPSDLEKIANYLNVSIETLIEKYLVWDFVEYEKTWFYLRPLRKNEKKCSDNTTHYLWNPYESCIFLNKINNFCIINKVKPRGSKWFCEIPIKDEYRNLVYTKEDGVKDFLGHPLNPYPNGIGDEDPE